MIAGAAARHQQLQGHGAPAEVLGDGRGREGGEAGQGVGGQENFAPALGRLSQGLEAALQIHGAKQLPAGGLGGWLLQVGLLQPLVDQGFVDLALAGPGAVGIKGEAAATELADGQIEQAVGGAAIPALDRCLPFGPRARRQQGEIGDAAQVEQGPPTADRRQQGPIGGGHQGRPLAAQGQVLGPEIKHHRPCQQFGQQGPLQQLPAGAALGSLGRAVPKGLAVAPHQLGLALGIAGPGRRSLGLGHGLGEIQQGGGWQALALAHGE